MKPFRFLILTGVGYLALVSIFGSHSPEPETTPTSVTTPEILYSPIPQAPVTTYRTTVEQSTTSTTTPLPVVLVGPDTPCQEWIPLAVQQGWPADRDVLETLASVIYKESRCVPIVPGDGYFNGHDHGLTQLNTVWLDEAATILGDPALIDTPAGNLKMAWHIYEWHETHVGCGWQPWGLKCH